MYVNYLKFREEIHVPEAVDRNQGKVAFALAQVLKGVSESYSISSQKVDVFCRIKVLSKASLYEFMKYTYASHLAAHD